MADRFGETIVVDHTGFARIVADHDHRSPTLTLAIDLWSGAPIGAAVLAEMPSPRGVLLALQDARRRVGQMHADDIPVWGRPRLVVASTPDGPWNALRAALLDLGFDLIERRDDHLHHGGPVKRIFGSVLGDLGLTTQAVRARTALSASVDAGGTAVLPLATIERLVAETLDQVCERRVPSGAWVTTPDLSRLDELLDDGSIIAVPPYRARPGPKRRVKPSDDTVGDRRSMLVRTVAARLGDLAEDVRVEASTDGSWNVAVRIVDPKQRAAAWLSLAQEAVRLAEREALPVTFEVTTSSED